MLVPSQTIRKASTNNHGLRADGRSRQPRGLSLEHNEDQQCVTSTQLHSAKNDGNQDGTNDQNNHDMNTFRTQEPSVFISRKLSVIKKKQLHQTSSMMPMPSQILRRDHHRQKLSMAKKVLLETTTQTSASSSSDTSINGNTVEEKSTTTLGKHGDKKSNVSLVTYSVKTLEQRYDEKIMKQSTVSNSIIERNDGTRRRGRRRKSNQPRMLFGNVPNLHWGAFDMDELRAHPYFVALPKPSEIRRLKNLEDVNMFRQDSWQWDVLHIGRITSSVLASSLGLLNPKSAKILGVPRSLQHRGAYRAWDRWSQTPIERHKASAALNINNETIEEEESLQTRTRLIVDALNLELIDYVDNNADDKNHTSTEEEENEAIWTTRTSAKYPFAAKYVAYPQHNTFGDSSSHGPQHYVLEELNNQDDRRSRHQLRRSSEQQQPEEVVNVATSISASAASVAPSLMTTTSDSPAIDQNTSATTKISPLRLRVNWGSIQEPCAILTAINYFTKNVDPNIQVHEVGMCLLLNGNDKHSTATFSNSTDQIHLRKLNIPEELQGLLGASPDALIVYPSNSTGTQKVEVLEVKNHCPFVFNNNFDPRRASRHLWASSSSTKIRASSGSSSFITHSRQYHTSSTSSTKTSFTSSLFMGDQKSQTQLGSRSSYGSSSPGYPSVEHLGNMTYRTRNFGPIFAKTKGKNSKGMAKNGTSTTASPPSVTSSSRLYEIPSHYIPQLMMEMACVGAHCRSAIMVRQTATNGTVILRLHRNDEWIEEMFFWLLEFKHRYVVGSNNSTNETTEPPPQPPPVNFFWEDSMEDNNSSDEMNHLSKTTWRGNGKRRRRKKKKKHTRAATNVAGTIRSVEERQQLVERYRRFLEWTKELARTAENHCSGGDETQRDSVATGIEVVAHLKNHEIQRKGGDQPGFYESLFLDHII